MGKPLNSYSNNYFIKTAVAVIGTAMLLFALLSPRAPNHVFAHSSRVEPLQTDTCSSCHKELHSILSGLYAESVHAANRVGCDQCHGGDSAGETKDEAHYGDFVGRASAKQITLMCGSCHSQQLETFNSSKHAKIRNGNISVNCAQCHGSHAIGSPGGRMTLSDSCSGCHGLEYLPELPGELKKVIAIADESGNRIKKVKSSGGSIATEAAQLRKEIRSRIGRIVHSTDRAGGISALPEIQKLGDDFLRSTTK